MPTVSENWSGRIYTPTKQAQRVFVVTFDSTEVGTATEQAAVSATVTYVVGGFPLEPVLQPQLPSTKRLGPVVFEVTWPFKPLPTPEFSGDPLLEPPSFSFKTGNFTDFCEWDKDGNPKVNSARQPLSPTPTREFIIKFIRVRKWMTLPALEAAAAFEQSVNSNELNIPGIGPIGPGELKCDAVEPLEDIVASTIAVPVGISLRYRKGQFELAAGIWDSWQSRHLDCGYMGITTDSPPKRARFVCKNDNNSFPAHPVLLDGTALPLDPPETGIGFITGTPGDQDSPDGADVDETVAGAVFLIYTDFEAKDFGAFNVF